MNKNGRRYNYVHIATIVFLVIILIVSIWAPYSFYLNKNHLEHCIDKYHWIDVKKVPINTDECFRILNNQ